MEHGCSDLQHQRVVFHNQHPTFEKPAGFHVTHVGSDVTPRQGTSPNPWFGLSGSGNVETPRSSCCRQNGRRGLTGRFTSCPLPSLRDSMSVLHGYPVLKHWAKICCPVPGRVLRRVAKLYAVAILCLTWNPHFPADGKCRPPGPEGVPFQIATLTPKTVPTLKGLGICGVAYPAFRYAPCRAVMTRLRRSVYPRNAGLLTTVSTVYHFRNLTRDLTVFDPESWGCLVK